MPSCQGEDRIVPLVLIIPDYAPKRYQLFGYPVKRFLLIVFLAPAVISPFKADVPVLLAGHAEERQEPGKGTANFIELHDIYLKWRDGFAGSRSYYRRVLYRRLVDLIGKPVVTGYDYYLESPEVIYETKLRFVFYNGNWLQIEGNVKRESIQKIIGNDPSMLYSWWRSKALLSVSGVVRHFRIDDWSRRIYMRLDNVTVKTSRKEEKAPADEPGKK